MLELENIVEEIIAKRTEKAQFQQLFADKVAQLRMALDNKTEQLDKDIYYLTQTARVEFEQLPYRSTPTTRKITLLSGEIIVKAPTQKLKEDKVVLLQKGPAYLVKIKETRAFDWAGYKKGLKIFDGQVVDTVTGEIVTEGVSIVDVPEEVVIK